MPAHHIPVLLFPHMPSSADTHRKSPHRTASNAVSSSVNRTSASTKHASTQQASERSEITTSNTSPTTHTTSEAVAPTHLNNQTSVPPKTTASTLTKADIEDALTLVFDPELQIDVVTMGLIYDVVISHTSSSTQQRTESKKQHPELTQQHRTSTRITSEDSAQLSNNPYEDHLHQPDTTKITRLENTASAPHVDITMTLTTAACPYGPQLLQDVEQAVLEAGAASVNINVVFNPPWKPTEELRAMLGV